MTQTLRTLALVLVAAFSFSAAHAAPGAYDGNYEMKSGKFGKETLIVAGDQITRTQWEGRQNKTLAPESVTAPNRTVTLSGDNLKICDGMNCQEYQRTFSAIQPERGAHATPDARVFTMFEVPYGRATFEFSSSKVETFFGPNFQKSNPINIRQASPYAPAYQEHFEIFASTILVDANERKPESYAVKLYLWQVTPAGAFLIGQDDDYYQFKENEPLVITGYASGYRPVRATLWTNGF